MGRTVKDAGNTRSLGTPIEGTSTQNERISEHHPNTRPINTIKSSWSSVSNPFVAHEVSADVMLAQKDKNNRAEEKRTIVST